MDVQVRERSAGPPPPASTGPAIPPGPGRRWC